LLDLVIYYMNTTIKTTHAVFLTSDISITNYKKILI
jgi:hypothetical protein